MTMGRAREQLKSANKAKRDALRKQCEATIATWDWGTFMRHHVEPDFMLRHKWRRGSPLPGPPNPPIAAAYGHAFDAQGRMVVQHQQVPSDDIYESFWIWGEKEGIAYHFPPGKTAKASKVSVYAVGVGGRIERVDSAHDEGGALTTVYGYDDAGRWIRAHLSGAYNNGEGKADHLEEVERDAKGRIVRLWVTQSSGHRDALIDKLKKKAAPKKKKPPAKKKKKSK